AVSGSTLESQRLLNCTQIGACGELGDSVMLWKLEKPEMESRTIRKWPRSYRGWHNETMTDNLRVRLADTDIPLGPLDGRYRGYVADLVDHLSEAALNRNRIHVEIEWFIHLADG